MARRLGHEINMTATMKELALRIDVNAADVCWALVSIGYPGWWLYEGERMRTPYLLEWLNRDHYENPIPYLQVELDEAQEAALAAELQVSVAELRFGIEALRS